MTHHLAEDPAGRHLGAATGAPVRVSRMDVRTTEQAALEMTMLARGMFGMLRSVETQAVSPPLEIPTTPAYDDAVDGGATYETAASLPAQDSWPMDDYGYDFDREFATASAAGGQTHDVAGGDYKPSHAALLVEAAPESHGVPSPASTASSRSRALLDEIAFLDD